MKTEKPFIKLLKSPNSGYFFDVNRNEIIAVSDEAYEFLEKEQQGIDCNATAEVSAELEALRENGYLSEHKLKNILHPMSQLAPTVLARKVEQMTLQLTQNCNMRCKYCIYSENNANGRHHNEKKMSYNTAVDAVKFFHNHSIDTDMVNIGFYGGEPLLEWNLLKDIMAYAKELFSGKKLSFSLTTNATLLNEEIIKHFVKNNVLMMISLDGGKEAHDKNRVFATNGKGTFNVVIEKLKWIYDRYPDYFSQLRLSIVLDTTTDYKLIDNMFLEYPFLNEIKITSNVVNDTYSEEKRIASVDFIRAYTYSRFLGLLSSFGRVNPDKVSPISKESAKLARTKAEGMSASMLGDVGAPGGPCIPGETKLFVDVFGKLYPCERVNENYDLTGIGNIYDGYDMEKVNTILNIAQISKAECASCWALNFCSQCIKDCISNNKISKEAKLKNCVLSKNGALAQLNEKIFFKELLNYRKKTEV